MEIDGCAVFVATLSLQLIHQLHIFLPQWRVLAVATKRRFLRVFPSCMLLCVTYKIANSLKNLKNNLYIGNPALYVDLCFACQHMRTYAFLEGGILT